MHKSIPFSGKTRVGILGGGQLGKMIIDEVMRYDIYVGILDPAESPPAKPYAHECIRGDFRRYEDVMAFAQDYDVITIEIEDVNTKALKDLEAAGKRVYPQPSVIDVFRNKCVQKQFYKDNGIPTSSFTNLKGKPTEMPENPMVWKAATGGYDGKGVSILETNEDVEALPDVPCVLEELVPIDREIGVVVQRSPSGELKVFPPVEMEFHPKANLVELVFAPASITQVQSEEAIALARKVAEATGIVGTLAVELFLDSNGAMMVNECAPRVHNSGHLSIEACFTSQFEQHIRAILDLPLGDTSLVLPAAMGNVVGEEGHTGPVHYVGAEGLLASSGVYLHLYGKKETRPFRKMGHITCINADVNVARKTVRSLRQTFKIRSQS